MEEEVVFVLVVEVVSMPLRGDMAEVVLVAEEAEVARMEVTTTRTIDTVHIVS